MTMALKTCLIGHGIGLSRTPRMHMAEGAAQGLDYRYDLIDTAEMDTPEISALLAKAEAEGYRGCNVTHPFKQTAMAHLDEVSTAAQAVRAVNTVVFREGKRFGHNTDYWGFATAFERGLPSADVSHVVQLGAGGAGGAVAHALLDAGVAMLEIRDVNQDAAERLVANLVRHSGADRVRVCTDLATAVQAASGIVNATPIGMATHPGSPVPADMLRPELWVADIVYFPLDTQLLRDARACGCRTLPGSGMALYQAVRAFELFTGRPADPDRMKATFDSF